MTNEDGLQGEADGKAESIGHGRAYMNPAVARNTGLTPLPSAWVFATARASAPCGCSAGVCREVLIRLVQLAYRHPAMHSASWQDVTHLADGQVVAAPGLVVVVAHEDPRAGEGDDAGERHQAERDGPVPGAAAAHPRLQTVADDHRCTARTPARQLNIRAVASAT